VYEVEAVTGDDKGAGTTARVYLELWGAVAGLEGEGGGEVRLVDLDSAVAPFQQGATDRFEVCAVWLRLTVGVGLWWVFEG
jgi:hypothetical protein